MPMAFSRLIWAGADYCRNNCYPRAPGSIVADFSPGSAGTEQVVEAELTKNKGNVGQKEEKMQKKFSF